MIASYNFFVCRHPIDGLRLAMRAFNPSVEKRLVLVTRHSSTSAMFFGHWCPKDYYGLPGLLRFDVEQLAVKNVEEGKKTHIVFSNAESESFSNSELLDRLRLRLATWQSVNVLLDYESLPRDLPPLRSSDSILCMWHVRDQMDESCINALRIARIQSDISGSKLSGPALYTRIGIDEESSVAAFEKVKHSLPSNSAESLLKL